MLVDDKTLDLWGVCFVWNVSFLGQNNKNTIPSAHESFTVIIGQEVEWSDRYLPKTQLKQLVKKLIY